MRLIMDSASECQAICLEYSKQARMRYRVRLAFSLLSLAEFALTTDRAIGPTSIMWAALVGEASKHDHYRDALGTAREVGTGKNAHKVHFRYG